MRKLLVSLCICLIVPTVSAQITASSRFKEYKPVTGVDKVFIINGVTGSDVLTYTGTNSPINWYEFSEPTISRSTANQFSPEANTGYILDVDGVQTNIWVVDYQFYKPVVNSLIPVVSTVDQCSQVNLSLDAVIPNITYKSLLGSTYSIPRIFNITYNTLEWDDSSLSWKTVPKTEEVTNPGSTITVKAPYCKTIFTISGDQFPFELGTDSLNFSSAEYTPTAVICKPTSIVSIRESLNEEERPSTATQLTGSAPLDINFLSNANIPFTEFYSWDILKNNVLIVNRTEENQRYTFTDAGKYTVRVTVSNSQKCSYSDSIIITVSESALYVPNVFTPNGDGFNDEFRVAYKSLKSFNAWIYNRWGRKVYYWSDPTKGWDGTINSKKASPGPYFYVINAVGSDGIKYKKTGDINLLRGKTN